MATYPINQGGKGSKVDVVPDAGIVKTLMSDGTERGYSDYTNERFILTISHPLLEQADWEAIIAFYEANTFVTNTVVTELEGTFDCLFSNRPRVVEKSGSLAKLVSEMTGVKVA